MQGDWRYLLTWIGLLVTRLAVTWLWLRPASGHVSASVIWMDIGITWTARSVALLFRHPQLWEAMWKA
ncbi:hypothetical protein [Alicyclobacillus hesperidum]|uniref:hypothetical protein n=1 Tax=Alicyclobacillus hesperidum TaxID=89784 RepID=UPI00178C484F|nr:hypothetical protein [Alicyclobacillus hesperidum]